MQLWDQEAICESPHKVPPAEVSVEVQPEPSLDDQLQLLIVSPDADALLNIKDQSETEIVAYCQTYASEQHIHSALADYVEYKTRGQHSSELWHALHHGRLTSSRFGEIFHRRHTTPTDRLVSSIMGYSSVYPTHAMIRGLACEQKAKKDYTALQKRLGFCVSVQKCGLTLMEDACYLGASCDGFVIDGTQRGILESKCPTQLDKVDVSHVKPLDIGQNAKFYCYVSENTLHLKKSSNHYCQVQGERE